MLSTFRKNSVLIILLVSVLIGIVPLAVFALDYNKNVIVLDAGHGGYDGGVSGITTGVRESDINYEIVKLIKGYLESEGFSVVLTRKNDIALGNSKREDMKKRVEKINSSNALIFVSIHSNFYSSSYRRGIQAFFNKEIDQELAEVIQERINKSLNLDTIKRNLSPLFGDYYILANSDIPSVLVECGFLSNVEDEKLLLDQGYRMKLAYTIFLGIKDYLGWNSLVPF